MQAMWRWGQVSLTHDEHVGDEHSTATWIMRSAKKIDTGVLSQPASTTAEASQYNNTLYRSILLSFFLNIMATVPFNHFYHQQCEAAGSSVANHCNYGRPKNQAAAKDIVFWRWRQLKYMAFNGAISPPEKRCCDTTFCRNVCIIGLTNGILQKYRCFGLFFYLLQRTRG